MLVKNLVKSLLCPYPEGSQACPNPVLNHKEQDLVYSVGKVCKPSSDHQIFSCSESECRIIFQCLLQSLPMPLRWKQTTDNQNYCGICFPDTGNWNFRTSKSTDPRLYPSTKRTISSARCNPICGQAPGASRTHGTFHSCLSSHHLWENSD